MHVYNRDIAVILNKVANLLDIKGANQFRVRAYRTAATTVENFSANIGELVKKGRDLSKEDGIGESIAEKIEEIVETGKLEQLEELEQEIPGELNDLMDVSDLGPKRVKTLYKKLDISTIDDLKKAAEKNKIRELDGFGEKLEETIVDEIKKLKSREGRGRIRYCDAEDIANDIVAYLQELDEIDQIDVAGSYRRRKETVGDLDILVICKNNKEVMDRFTAYEDIERVVSQGDTRSSIRLRTGTQIDLRVVQKKNYGAALQYFTGSKEHSVALRKKAQSDGLKINEYGVFKGDTYKAGKDEEEVYAALGYDFIPPELRENRGELEAARTHALPSLIEEKDLQGDLHVHSNASDGRNTIREMAEAAKEFGYRYIAITDHSKGLAVTGGLDEEGLKKQIDEIAEINEDISGFRVLSGIELDIHEDGSLDLEDSVLEKLDIVVASIHSKFKLSEKKQTERMLAAVNNPLVNVIAHPTGRLIGQRDAYAINLEKIFKACSEKNCFLEINSFPDRLDLNDTHCITAREFGVGIVISTDSHSPMSLRNIRYGVFQARRGWLSRKDIINTRKWQHLKKALHRNSG
jgi:DNA polymerase (family 10)